MGDAAGAGDPVDGHLGGVGVYVGDRDNSALAGGELADRTADPHRRVRHPVGLLPGTDHEQAPPRKALRHAGSTWAGEVVGLGAHDVDPRWALAASTTAMSAAASTSRSTAPASRAIARYQPTTIRTSTN